MESSPPSEPGSDPVLASLKKIMGTLGGPRQNADEHTAAHEQSFSPEKAQTQYLTEASKLADGMLQQFFSRRALDEEPNVDDMDALNVLAFTAEQAANAGDGNNFDIYLAAYLEAHPKVAFISRGSTIANLCMQGIHRFGSQKATVELHRQLEAEAARADHLEELSKQGRVLGSGYDATATSCLAEVIAYCQINGLPPEQWLNQYAKNENHVRTLRMHAIRETQKAGKGDAQALEDQYTMLSLEDKLIRGHKRSALRTAFDNLHETKEPAAREQAREQFLQALDKLPPLTERDIITSDPVLHELIELGRASLQDSQPAGKILVSKIDEAIGKRVGHTLQAGGDLLHTSLPYMSWKLDVGTSSEADAQTVLGILDNTISEVLALRPSSAREQALDEESRDNPRFVLMIKDYIGGTYIEEALANNNFTEAGKFARGLSKRAGTLARAITLATNKEQIGAFNAGSDPMELMMEPEIQILLDFSEAKFTRGPQAFADALMAYAKTTTDMSPMEGFMTHAFRYITSQDSSVGQGFARDLLATLRAKANRENYGLRKNLSEMLIRAGDQEEIQLARQDINKYENPYQKWIALRQLADVIADLPKQV